MSYTFSRRDFMKYTALTAVAIAGLRHADRLLQPEPSCRQDR